MNYHSKPNRYVSHVSIKVLDFDRSLKFYTEVIGFQVLSQEGQTATLTADGKTGILTIEQPVNAIPKPRRALGIYHFALLFSKRSDLANMVFQLVRYNVEIGAGDHKVSEAIYIVDPDGNEIEIAYDNDPSEWNWNHGEVEMTVEAVDFNSLLAEGDQQAPWTGLPKDTIMGHIHLYVGDLEETKQFYIDGLGYEVVNNYGGQALFISTGNYHHHIALNTWMGRRAPILPENSVGLKSYTIVLEDEETRQQVIKQLEAIGASVTEENGSVVTYDPAKNRIILAI